MFARGVPGLPTEGMRALPHQLAAPLKGRIALNHKATHIEREGNRWRVRGPDAVVSATDVVVATDPATAAGLTGQSAPPTHGVVTDWWAADEAPSTLPMLWVDGRPNPAGAGAEHRRHQRRRAHLCAAGTAFDQRVGPAGARRRIAAGERDTASRR